MGYAAKGGPDVMASGIAMERTEKMTSPARMLFGAAAEPPSKER